MGTSGIQATPPEEPTPAQNAPASKPADSDDAPTPAEKKRTVMAATYIVIGIAFTGLALLTLIILWGHRLRRITRTSPSRQTQVDPFWYLRPKKTPGGWKSDQPSDSRDQGDSRDEEGSA